MVTPLDYPAATNQGVSIRMRANRRRDTKPEVAARSALHRRGLRFRVDHPIDVGSKLIRPDIVFTRKKIAVFVDGCFWHQCPAHGSMPRTNVDYWLPKLERNVRRDRLDDGLLRTAGWIAVRAWEHESAEQVAQRVIKAIDSASDRMEA